MPTLAEQPKMKGYLKLLNRFSLKAIADDAEHGKAVAVVQDLMGRKLDRGEGDYLSALIILVNQYEDENHHIIQGMTPQQALKAIMAANGLTQAEIGQIIGSESAVSMFLKGERELSKERIKKLVDRFKVDASLFL